MHLHHIHIHHSRRHGFELDMLNGPVMPKLLTFAVPLILSSVLQLTFNAADVIVVGKFEGDAALAAVGAPGSLINLLVNLFLGLSVGANVVVARYHGAGDFKQTSDGVHTSMLLSVLSGVAVGFVGFFLAGTFLTWMNTPDEVLPLATAYMRIYFLGMPANMIYNFGAAILRAIGDTRRPLMYLTVAGVVNVILNIVFVAAFGMGVSGVAWATITAQIISAILVVLCLIRTEGSIHLDITKLRLDLGKVWEIAKIGLPAGLQGICFSISNVIIQSTVNGFGTIATAGNTAASNIEGYIYVSMNAIYQAAITFTSQNVGAHRYDRISRVTRAALMAVTGIGLGLGMILLLFMRVFFHIYTDDPAVIEAAAMRSSIIAPTYFLCGTMDTMVGVLRGMGASVIPMIVSVAGICVLRLAWIAFIYPFNPTLTMLYLSYPISWLITFTVHLICYFRVKRRKYGVGQGMRERATGNREQATGNRNSG